MQKRIIMTADDIERLEQLLEATSHRSDHAELAALGRELDRAEIVAADEVSTNIVTINSRVCFHDLLYRDMELVCSIVFPAEANADEKKISVLFSARHGAFQVMSWVTLSVSRHLAVHGRVKIKALRIPTRNRQTESVLRPEMAVATYSKAQPTVTLR